MEELIASGEIEKLRGLADKTGLFKGAQIGACLGFTPEMEEFAYMFAIEPNESDDLGELRQINVPALTWAVFTGWGASAEAHQRVWKAIYGEWFPATDYIHLIAFVVLMPRVLAWSPKLILGPTRG